MQQRAIEVVSQAAEHILAGIRLGAQRAHPAVGDDRDRQQRDGSEEHPAYDEREQADTVGTAT
jgi:hypothetical protein